MKPRCYLVLALAPPGTKAREANDRVNEYVADARRGLSVWHDHFVHEHGGAVVFEVHSEDQLQLLQDPGPLGGWTVSVYPLTFSLTAVGFAAQTAFTMKTYRGIDLEALAEAEVAGAGDRRHWWQRSPSRRDLRSVTDGCST